MYDATSPSDDVFENSISRAYDFSRSPQLTQETLPSLQRARGQVRISVGVKDGRTRLKDLYQDGCAKVRLPKVYGSEALETVLLNTAGGLTGGDRINSTVDLGANAMLDVTTQACERVYRSLGSVATVTTQLRLCNSATLHWLPQETILFDGGRFCRTLDVSMAEDASLLAVEPIVFGRVASGETLGDGLFYDSWRVRRAGQLVFADDTRLEGPLDDIISRPAVLAGAKATATVLLVAPDAPSLLDPARDVLASYNAGASSFNGMLLCRIVAPNSMALRAALVPLLTLFRGGLDLPRAWHL